MTRNQISYATHLENVRHNKATELQSSKELAETSRHNVSTEGIQSATQREQGRHNIATENETNRHNLVTEGQQGQVINEQVRHNYATENETNRSNLRNESIKQQYNAQQYELGLANVDIANRQLSESNRHNMATEYSSLMSSQASIKQADIAERRQVADEIASKILNSLNEAKTEYTQAQIDEVIATIDKMKQEVAIAQRNSDTARINAIINGADVLLTAISNRQRNINGLLKAVGDWSSNYE